MYGLILRDAVRCSVRGTVCVVCGDVNGLEGAVETVCICFDERNRDIVRWLFSELNLMNNEKISKKKRRQRESDMGDMCQFSSVVYL